jgi:hypothetical protein
MSCFLSYISSITGDCTNTNSGAFTINIEGEAPDYTIQWLSPPNGTISLGAGVTAYTQTNLSAGTYSFNIIDSCISGNTVLPVNIYISDGTCVSITNITNTVCNSNNGTLTTSTSNSYGQASFYLYNNITGLIANNIIDGNTYTFTDLSSGTYYVIAGDGGGCTGKSESVIIKNSSNLSFGLYKVDNAGCAVDSGKLMITGLTGTPPYSYLWSNGGVEDNITGLTAGVYTVTVTDNSGCSVSNTEVINNVSQVGLGALYLTQPSCFTTDGEIEIIITGGTPPFYYLGSNGVANITFDRTVTFTGLGPGGFTIQVTDAGLCNFSTSTNLLTPNGISTVNVDITNSTCNDFSGVVGPITVFGGTSPYTYSLTSSSGNIKTNTVYQTNWSFDGLSADTYTLTITDNGNCTFTGNYTVSSFVKFGLTTYTTGTTCNGSNGSVYLQITSGGTPPYIYQINGSTITTSLTSYTFNNLTSGNYTASVTDSSFCKQSKPFTIGTSNAVDFHLLSVDSQNNDGSLSAYITNGQPPFTLYWSGDVGNQTGTTVNNLTDGNYSARVVDVNGCSKTKKTSIKGNTNYNSTGYYTICSSNKLDQPITILSGPKQILNEGYNQIISESPEYTNCILNTATFEALVSIGVFNASSIFYTSTNLLEYPSNELWYTTIQGLLESLPQVGDVNINSSTNTIVITTNCDESSLVNSDVLVKMKIYYEIDCVCPISSPSPTPTQTMTPTPTITPTMTPIPLEEFIINAVGVNQIYSTYVNSGFTITSSLTFKIDWGDGNIETFPSGTTRTNHIYSSPYTGQIKILSTNLTTITSFESNTAPHNNQSLWTSTSELQKLDGLLTLATFVSDGLFITGNVLNLPRTITYLNIFNNNISGNTSNLPPSLNTMIIYGSNTISGDTLGFPVGMRGNLILFGNNTVSGNTSNLPRVTNSIIWIIGQNTISGDTSGLPSTREIRIQGQNTISGNLSNLPRSLTACQFDGLNTISGNISTLPPSIQILVINGDNTVSGDVLNFPRTLIAVSIRGYNTITGNVSTLPPNLTSLILENKTYPILVTIFGDISTLPSNLITVTISSNGIFSGNTSNLPSKITSFTLTGNITFSYSSGRVWANNFIRLQIIPIIGSWTGFTSTETDNLLIDIQPKYIYASNNSFTIKCGSTPKRTSASDAAYNALVTLIGASNVNLT